MTSQNLGLVKKHTTQSQWIGSKQFIQNDLQVFFSRLSKMGLFLPKLLVKKFRNSSSVARSNHEKTNTTKFWHW